jgi:hypothetical protein
MIDVVERERRLERREMALEIETRPIRADLERAGVFVRSIWDLVNTSIDYSHAVPVLAHHLCLPYSDITRGGLARSLAIKASGAIWPLLVREYKTAPCGTGIVAPGETQELPFWAKDGLAVALSVAVTRDTLPELVALAEDQKNGPSRLLLLRGIKKFRNPSGKEILRRFANDPDLALQVREWLKMPKASGNVPL